MNDSRRARACRYQLLRATRAASRDLAPGRGNDGDGPREDAPWHVGELVCDGCLKRPTTDLAALRPSVPRETSNLTGACLMAGLSSCLERADASAGFCAGHRKYVGEESSSDNWCRCSSPFVQQTGGGSWRASVVLEVVQRNSGAAAVPVSNGFSSRLLARHPLAREEKTHRLGGAGECFT